MYRTKKDVDKHVESLISKLSVKEFKTRAYSVARLYFDVGDFSSCQRYVEQYLSQKDNNAAAHKLLGQALQKLGEKEKSLEQFKISLDIDPTQTSTILDICELLADEEISIDPGRAKYWCEKAEATFPRHPVTFRLRERLVTMSNPDPEALVKLLLAELVARPKDVQLHARLLKHYLHSNKFQEAFTHACNVEFGGNTFSNNYGWYETLTEVLKPNLHDIKDWNHQLLLLTVRERSCVLSLTETPSGTSRSLVESSELLHAYDQALETVAKAGAQPGFAEFHASLLQHHRGQFAFHAATFLLKKAKKDQLSWRDATRVAAPLMLIAWQTVPLDPKVNWLIRAPEKHQVAVSRWYTEGTYRYSQAGHYLLENIQDKSQTFLDKISQSCAGSHWKDKIYEKLFTSRDHLAKIKSSHLVSDAYNTPVLRLPRKVEVEAYDGDAQREYANSLHHFVWTLLNYKNFAHFKCTLFDMLTPTKTNCGPETLNKLDVHAFLYCAAMASKQQKQNEMYVSPVKPALLPANITDLLCPLPQMKWWDCACKFSQNELGSELTDIRATLSRGIEVVRCVDNHGLDPELLCILGKIFGERAKLTTAVDEKNNLEIRAGLYYESAIPLLEKLKNKIAVKMPEKRLFDYTHKELGPKELNSLIEESKVYVAENYYNNGEYEKAIELLNNVKSPEAYYYLSQIYKKIAHEEHNTSKDNSSEVRSKFASLMTKAKNLAYKAIDRIKETDGGKNNPIYTDIQNLIEDIETNINKIDVDISDNNDIEGKYSSSDEYISIRGREQSMRNNNDDYVDLSSTPKCIINPNSTNYRSAVNCHIETTRSDQQFIERLENQIKSFQKRLAEDFMDQTKSWFEDNRRLGNQIMSTLQSDIQNTTDQFKLLKVSVDQIKDQVDECRTECKDVGDLRKQIADLKKEVNKLKKASSEQTIDESDLYNLEEEYRASESTSSFAAQMPFQSPQMMPPFNQRLVPPFPVPPNPYQLYNQSLYNLYNQYSQFAQTPSVGGTSPLFDPTRTSMNYPGMYQTPDQMYLDIAHLVPPAMPAAAAPMVPPVPHMPNVPNVPVPPLAVHQPPPQHLPTMSSKSVTSTETKNLPRSALPVNVVITSSDPLPTCTTTPAPILSVKIPPQHIKGPTPHNYQIQMPSTTENKAMSPLVFSFPASGNKAMSSSSTVINWSTSNVFKTAEPPTTGTYFSLPNESLDASKDAADGAFTSSTSLDKSRTLSERSNTSVENYDPCSDYKPIIPLPAEVTVKTGEEDEITVFSARAKLFRFDDKQWKERGIGEMKLLKHKVTGKVRVLMRREQVHKICANHIIVPEMEIKQMKNEEKAYFWVANDFADETVVLEKFCIRFKTAELAQKFYETFEKARLESKDSTPKSTPKSDVAKSTPKPSDQKSTTVKTPSFASLQTKTQVGGFTFTSTPTFRTVQDESINENQTTETPTSKPNIFSNLSFKTSTSSPFSNLLGAFSSPATTIYTPDSKQETSIQNTSDVVEEFEPNVEFKPVVPLPALVEHKTGEEEETVLFEHRAKLFRFEASNKEWKERGIGNVKLLVHKDNVQKLRLLMRREQVMKVCCNHGVTKDMVFQKMTNLDKAVTWCAKDFSEGELVNETFCLRFKTVQECDNFMQALTTAQSQLKDDSKAAKEEQNAAKQSNQSGFGDKFKPKPGSWLCDGCYTNNLESYTKCGCCEASRPQPDKVNETVSNTPNTSVTLSWGDKFKPKTGSWECAACFVRNEANVEFCSACDSPKDPNAPKKQQVLVTANAPQFKFGIPAQPADVKKELKSATSAAPAVTSSWGNQFKPKEGSWECKQCFVRNEANNKNCSACSNPNPVAKTDENEVSYVKVTAGNTGPKFNFGLPQNVTVTVANQKNKSENNTMSIFDGTGAHKFSFGNPEKTSEKAPTVVAFGGQQPTTLICGVKPATGIATPINLTPKAAETKPAKPALLPTPQPGTPPSNSFLGNKDGTFDFKFKPKSPTKGKSPMKSPKSQAGDDSDNEYASEDEGHHIQFSPVVPLPDKIEVVTGEENETELYGHRAKLFRFVAGEWKERGIGIVKILKHKDTGKLRVVMRREQIHKICLNHALTPEIVYSPKDDKTWLFAANDFSEGELSLQQFCLRFKNKDIALEFKDAVENAREGKLVAKEENKELKGSDSDVVFVSETHASEEDQKKAAELMLPKDFYTYKTKEPCKGCRGCAKDSDAPPEPLPSISTMKLKNLIESTSTPIRSNASIFSSPTTSIYGTPANYDKTADNTIFRTPLGSTGSIANSTLTGSPDSVHNDSTNKENTFTPSNMFGGLDSKPSIFENFGQNSASSEAAQTTSASKGGILAAPKLSTLNTSGENQAPENKSIFSSTPTKPLFGEANKSIFGEAKSIFGNINSGVSTNKSIFGLTPAQNDDKAKPEVKSIFGGDDLKPVNLFTGTTPGSLFGLTPDQKGDKAKPEVKSIFGGDEVKPVNLFSGTTKGSLFGPGSLRNNQPNATSTWSFSANSSATEASSLFGGASQASTWSVGEDEQKKPDFTLTTVSNNQSKIQEKPEKAEKEDEAKKETLFKVDNNLSFAALSSGGPGFNIQKNPSFQWEGAGQQLFGGAQRTGDRSANESGAGDESAAGADDEYDPHYEPIVPLPDKIVVTTGEEDEEKLFGERCKLYRYDDKTKEWKERGVGEMKILYHPERNTYRLLLRREQVHKAVLNMLLFMDLELLPMKNSDKAWTWAGINYAEVPAGEQETLAVRFKSLELATAFHGKVIECVRKLQGAAAQAIKEEKETTPKQFEEIKPLRQPKVFGESPKVITSAEEPAKNQIGSKSNGQANPVSELFKQVHFQEAQEVDADDDQDDEEDYDPDYDQDDYDAYYNEEDDESNAFYVCDVAAVFQQGSAQTLHDNARVQVMFDQDVYTPRIMISHNDTGEVLADMLIHTDTEFQMHGDACTWTGLDYTSNEPVDKTVTLSFPDTDNAALFYDSCVKSKGATYASTDPES